MSIIHEMAVDELEQTIASLRAELAGVREDAERYRALNTPEIADFLKAVEREALHQRERWAHEHDAGKSPEDWMWLIAYLATKATQAARYNDPDKYLHHIVTTGAAILNWHAHAVGADTRMRPGSHVNDGLPNPDAARSTKQGDGKDG